MHKQKEARLLGLACFFLTFNTLVVTIAVAKGTHRSCSDPALVGARKVWANSDQKEGVCAGARNGIECPGEIRIPLRVKRHWRCGENGLIVLARIAYERALDLINAARSARGIAAIQHQSINIEGNMSGR